MASASSDQSNSRTMKTGLMRAKGRTIEKVMGVGGGGAKYKKKFMQGKIDRKKKLVHSK